MAQLSRRSMDRQQYGMQGDVIQTLATYVD